MSLIDDFKIILLLLFALVLRSGVKTFYFAIVCAYVQGWSGAKTFKIVVALAWKH